MIPAAAKKKLRQRLGRDKVHTEPEYLLTHAYDATELEFLPDAVVTVENAAQIRAVLETADEFKLPVIPRGAGVGYSGGALAVEGGIVLAFPRMNRILEISREDYLAVVEPGVVTVDLQQAVEKMGLFYPPDPASLKTSTIGGNVAENAGGPRCFKYGVTAHYVLAIEAFLVDGRPIRVGSRTLKNVAGYDLKSLLVGSEGTLAVFNRLTLRLIPKPERRILFRLGFVDLKKGAACIHAIIRANLQPSVLEFMDRAALTTVQSYLGRPADDRIQASVLVELDGGSSLVAADADRLRQLAAAEGAAECLVAENEKEQDELWLMRRSISPAIAKLRPRKVNEDIVVPVGRIPEAVGFINGLGREHELPIVLFGHFGDGNIHTNILIDPAEPEEVRRCEAVLDRLFRYVVSIGGAISGEHGIGLTKRPFMHFQFTADEMELFRGVKMAFDPENRLNPGKIF